jgi:hypothetical protein
MQTPLLVKQRLFAVLVEIEQQHRARRIGKNRDDDPAAQWARHGIEHL